jgi:hypothetical protein
MQSYIDGDRDGLVGMCPIRENGQNKEARVGNSRSGLNVADFPHRKNLEIKQGGTSILP